MRDGIVGAPKYPETDGWNRISTKPEEKVQVYIVAGVDLVRHERVVTTAKWLSNKDSKKPQFFWYPLDAQWHGRLYIEYWRPLPEPPKES